MKVGAHGAEVVVERGVLLVELLDERTASRLQAIIW
jgi:hypothetical protein